MGYVTVTHIFVLIYDTDFIIDLLGKMLICNKLYVLEALNAWLVSKTMNSHPI